MADVLRYQCLSDEQAAVGEAAEAAFGAGVTEEGWSGLSVPEELGGSGGGAGELAAFVEALGTVVSGSALGWTLGVLGAVLAEAGNAGRSLLAGVAEGEATASLPVPAGGGGWPVLAEGRVSGSFLALGEASGVLALPVLSGGEEALALVRADQEGVAAAAVAGMDASRPWATYHLRNARAEEGTVSRVPGLEGTLRRAAGVYAGLDAAGAARSALERTVAYSRVREQFGRPLGSFQAYKHACATAFIDLKLAQSVSFRAAVTPGAAGLRYALASAVEATAAAVRVCMAAVQLHGGIGFSAETGLDRYLRRARADELIAGRRGSMSALLAAMAPAVGPHDAARDAS
jgi:alkylation response protein AidB-like acyl-CoA dehydrogenase